MPGQGRQVVPLLAVGDAAQQGFLLFHTGMLRVPREEVGAIYLPSEYRSSFPTISCAM